MTTNYEKFLEFTETLHEWKVLRDAKDEEQGSVEIVDDGCHLSLADLIKTVTAIPDLSSSSTRMLISGCKTVLPWRFRKVDCDYPTM